MDRELLVQLTVQARHVIADGGCYANDSVTLALLVQQLLADLERRDVECEDREAA